MIMIDLAGVIAQAPCQNQLGQTCSQSLRNLFRAGFHDDSLDDYDVMLMRLTASSCFTLVTASCGARPSLKFIMSRGPLWYLILSSSFSWWSSSLSSSSFSRSWMCHEGRTEHHLSYGWKDHINLDALVPEFIIVITLIAITRRRNQTYLPDLRASLVKRAAWSSGLPELMMISPSITVNLGQLDILLNIFLISIIVFVFIAINFNSAPLAWAESKGDGGPGDQTGANLESESNNKRSRKVKVKNLIRK